MFGFLNDLLSEINDVFKIVLAIVSSAYILQFLGYFRTLSLFGGGAMSNISGLSGDDSKKVMPNLFANMLSSVMPALQKDMCKMFEGSCQPSSSTSNSEYFQACNDNDSDDDSELVSLLKNDENDKLD